MHDSCRNMNIYYKHTHTHTFISAYLCLDCCSMWNGPLTMEWKTTPCSIFSSPIFCHAFVCPSVFLLEIGYFKDGVWILQFDFAGERNTAGSPPAYFWDRAVKEEQKVPKVAAVCHSDQSMTKHRGNVVGSIALWIIVLDKSKLDCSDFLNS